MKRRRAVVDSLGGADHAGRRIEVFVNADGQVVPEAQATGMIVYLLDANGRIHGELRYEVTDMAGGQRGSARRRRRT